MTKKLTKIVFYTAILSYSITMILCKLFIINDNPMDQLLYVVATVTTIYLTLGTLTAYLNLYKVIRTRKLYSLLSFFLLPLIIAVRFILIGPSNSTFFNVKASMLLPYFVILTYYFIKFRKSQYVKA